MRVFGRQRHCANHVRGYNGALHRLYLPAVADWRALLSPTLAAPLSTATSTYLDPQHHYHYLCILVTTGSASKPCPKHDLRPGLTSWSNGVVNMYRRPANNVAKDVRRFVLALWDVSSTYLQG